MGAPPDVCCIPLQPKNHGIVHQPPWLMYTTGCVQLLPRCSEGAMQQLLKSRFWVSSPPGALVSYENRVQRASCGKCLKLINFCRGKGVGCLSLGVLGCMFKIDCSVEPHTGGEILFPFWQTLTSFAFLLYSLILEGNILLNTTAFFMLNYSACAQV